MHHFSTRGSIASLAAIVVWISACGLFEPPRRNLTVSLVTQVSIPAARLHARIGDQRVVLRADGVGETSKQLAAPGATSLPVSVALLDSAEDTLASVVFNQGFAGRDSDHWISARVGINRPVGFCIGLLAVAALTTGPDSLFVTYGSIPRGAIC